MKPFWSKTAKRWVVRYKQAGKQRERKFVQQTDALTFATEVWQDQQDGINSGDMTVEQLVRRFLDSKKDKAPSTQQDYAYSLGMCQPLYPIPIESVTPIQLEDFLDTIATSSNQSRVRTQLRTLFRQAVNWQLIRRNPVDGTKPRTHKPAKAAIFSPEDVGTILKTVQGERMEALILLGFTLGPRPGELFGFQWQDWNEDEAELSVVRNVTSTNGRQQVGPPKTSASVRTLQLPYHVNDAIHARRKMAMREGFAHSEDFIWCNVRGNPKDRVNFHAQWKAFIACAGVPYLKPYCMRHTAASTMLNGLDNVGGVPLAVVSEVLGHENAQITLERYSHVLKADHEQVRTFWNRAKLAVTGGV